MQVKYSNVKKSSSRCHAVNSLCYQFSNFYQISSPLEVIFLKNSIEIPKFYIYQPLQHLMENFFYYCFKFMCSFQLSQQGEMLTPGNILGKWTLIYKPHKSILINMLLCHNSSNWHHPSRFYHPDRGNIGLQNLLIL